MPGQERYRLTYFPGQGRAELIRLIFHAARVPFVDRRVTADDWKALKPKTPNGHCPVLEIDNQAFDESGAIALWAARKFGLLGKTDADELKTIAIVLQTNDFRERYMLPAFVEKEPTKKEELTKELLDEMNKLLARWEPTVLQTESNHFKTFSYMVCNQLTAADLALLYLSDLAAGMVEVNWQSYPCLAAVLRTVRALQPIRDYLATRDGGSKPGITRQTQTESRGEWYGKCQQ